MQDEQAGWRVVGQSAGLQEEVYSWSLTQDPFGSVYDDDMRDDLRDALLDRLNVSLPPAQRSVAVLRDFVERADRAIQEGHSGPLTSDSNPAADAAHTPSEPNPLLALALHLKWLVRCFGNRPNMSVSVR